MMKVLTSFGFILLCTFQLIQAQVMTKSLFIPEDQSYNLFPNDHFEEGKKFVLYLPSVRYGVAQEGPKITDYVYRDEQNRLIFDPVNALSQAEDENVFQSGGYVNGLSLAYKINEKLTLFGGYGIEYLGHINYPFEALQIYTAGNALLLGENLDLGFESYTQAFHKYSFGVNWTQGNLTTAIKLSYLSGIADVSTSAAKINVAISPFFYAFQFDNDFRINTNALLQYQSLDEIFIEYTGDFAKSFWSSNRGFTVDIGIQYQIDEKLKLTAQLSQLGSISWKEDISNYSSEGEFEFSGLNILDFISINSNVSYIDSLENTVDIVESFDAYSTKLPISIDASVEYKYNASISFGGGIGYKTILNSSNLYGGISASYKFNDQISLGASYSYYQTNFMNIGLSGKINFGPLVLFASTQNILGITNTLDVNYSNNTIGFNLLF